jgi:molybdenum cofactor biosynthesis enzyme MoaA
VAIPKLAELDSFHRSHGITSHAEHHDDQKQLMTEYDLPQVQLAVAVNNCRCCPLCHKIRLTDPRELWLDSRFYERAVKIKHLTADRPTGRKPIVAASPASVETNDFNQLCRHSAPHHNVMSSSETEKQCGGR